MAGVYDMLFDLSKARIFIRPGYTDLRKAVNGLSVMIEQQMGGSRLAGMYIYFAIENGSCLRRCTGTRPDSGSARNGLKMTSIPGRRTRERRRS